MDRAPGLTVLVNLGNPGEFTRLELAESVLRLTGTQSKLTFKSLLADNLK
jgi:UDP-glucuronate decarboxylase